MPTLSTRLAAGERILIDGGTGTLIESRGATMTPGIWCGSATLTDPEVVQRVHEEYIEAGAEVIIANTYACSRHLLATANLADRFEEANRRGVELARAARDRMGVEVAVAGSLSTTEMGGEMPPVDVARANFIDQARILADAGAELLVLEMMREIEQTLIAIEAAATTGLPVWVGLSAVMIEGESEPYLFGERGSMSEAMRALDGLPVELIAVMHTETAIVERCLDVVDEYWTGPIGVYAHTGRFEPPNWVFEGTISADDYADAATGWLDRGVQVVGGCCGIHPDHIEALRPIVA